MANKIAIYSADWCAYCHAAKDYLDKLGVEYTVKDVESNIAVATEAVTKSGQTGIPVLDIEGDIVIGFNRPKIDELLKKHKLIAA